MNIFEKILKIKIRLSFSLFFIVFICFNVNAKLSKNAEELSQLVQVQTQSVKVILAKPKNSRDSTIKNIFDELNKIINKPIKEGIFTQKTKYINELEVLFKDEKQSESNCKALETLKKLNENLDEYESSLFQLVERLNTYNKTHNARLYDAKIYSTPYLKLKSSKENFKNKLKSFETECNKNFPQLNKNEAESDVEKIKSLLNEKEKNERIEEIIKIKKRADFENKLQNSIKPSDSEIESFERDILKNEAKNINFAMEPTNFIDMYLLLKRDSDKKEQDYKKALARVDFSKDSDSKRQLLDLYKDKMISESVNNNFIKSLKESAKNSPKSLISFNRDLVNLLKDLDLKNKDILAAKKELNDKKTKPEITQSYNELITLIQQKVQLVSDFIEKNKNKDFAEEYLEKLEKEKKKFIDTIEGNILGPKPTKEHYKKLGKFPDDFFTNNFVDLKFSASTSNSVQSPTQSPSIGESPSNTPSVNTPSTSQLATVSSSTSQPILQTTGQGGLSAQQAVPTLSPGLVQSISNNQGATPSTQQNSNQPTPVGPGKKNPNARALGFSVGGRKMIMDDKECMRILEAAFQKGFKDYAQNRSDVTSMKLAIAYKMFKENSLEGRYDQWLEDLDQLVKNKKDADASGEKYELAKEMANMFDEKGMASLKINDPDLYILRKFYLKGEEVEEKGMKSFRLFTSLGSLAKSELGKLTKEELGAAAYEREKIYQSSNNNIYTILYGHTLANMGENECKDQDNKFRKLWEHYIKNDKATSKKWENEKDVVTQLIRAIDKNIYRGRFLNQGCSVNND